MSTLPVVFRIVDQDGVAFVAPRQEDGHGSEIGNPSFSRLTDSGGNSLTFINSVPSETAYGLPVRLVGGESRVSTVNSSTTPLNNGATFTGTAELNNYVDIMVTCYTDRAGTLYVDLGPDGINWDSIITFSVDASTPETHRLVKGARYVRLRFTNNSGNNQSVFRLNTYFGDFGVLNSALNSTIAEDADALVVRSIPAELDIAAGRFQGYSTVNKFGTNADIDTASVPEDIWEGGGVYTGFPDSTLETISVFSSDANDTSAGTGARTIRISGLDTNYVAQSETITLSGVTPVASVNQYRRLHTATIMSAGSGGVNVGTITARHTTTTANVFLSIQPGRNQSNCSGYTVPAGYTAYMRALHCTIRGTAQLTQAQAVEGQIWTRTFGQPFRSRRPFISTSNSRLQDVIFGGLSFTEKSDIILRITTASDNNISVNGGYDLILVKNI